ncbi:MAG: rRNA adenine N-6-methyltransferase family protein [Patescibacteria group bacterium]
MQTPVNQPLLFLKKFLKHGITIASITPSTKFLSQRTVAGIDWNQARLVVELGAGTGPITQEIVNRARPECTVIVIEQDDDFLGILRNRFGHLKHVHIIKSDCTDLAVQCAKLGLEKVDYVVSGLPTPSLPKHIQKAVFSFYRSHLASTGAVHQITEFPLLFKPFYKKHFAEVEFTFEPRGIPPAGVYVCRKPKG